MNKLAPFKTSKHVFINVFLWKFFKIVKALPCSCLMRNKALDVWLLFFKKKKKKKISISAARLVFYIV